MSRIGKLEINIPNGIVVDIAAGVLTVKGPKGELKRNIRDEVRFNIAENKITSEPARNDKFSKSL